MLSTDSLIVSAAFTLFLVMDPVGNIPVWLAILKDVPPHRQRTIVFRENLIALLVLLAFFLFGPFILKLFGVGGPALGIAGGVVMFIIAIRMIFRPPGGIFGDEQTAGEPLIVPLAIPLLAGPSAITVVTLMGSNLTAPPWQAVTALVIAWAVGLVILLAGPRIAKILGQRGINATERLMGMILTVIAVQMTLEGIRSFFNI